MSSAELDIYSVYPDLLDPDVIEGFDFASAYSSDPGSPFSEREVAIALIHAYGNLTAAARLLKRSRKYMSNFIARNPMLVDLQDEIETSFMDDVEHAHKLSAVSGNAQARQFFLTTKGRDRGYGNKVDVASKTTVIIEEADSGL